MYHWGWFDKWLLRGTGPLIAGIPGLDAIGSEPAKHIGSPQQCADDRPRRCLKGS